MAVEIASESVAPTRNDALPPAIEARDLHRAFGPSRILRGVDLAIPDGQISVVLGPSGTGKSVLIKHIVGLLQPDRGEILIHGRRIARMSRSELMLLRREIGVMYQDGALFSAMDVFDNTAFPLRQHTNLTEAEIKRVVMPYLRAVGLADAAAKFPAQLSGGMKKRAGLARALVLEPRIVLCDEPDSGLDPVRSALLGDLLLDVHREVGGTFVIVTHNVALARTVAEHLSILWQGRIVDSGPSAELFDSKIPFIRQFLAGETEGPLGMDA